jgi:hypothetical protein
VQEDINVEGDSRSEKFRMQKGIEDGDEIAQKKAKGIRA